MHRLVDLLILFLLVDFTSAASPLLPAQTIRASDQLDVGGWTPRPTSSPSPLELFKRQNVPNSVCGYIDGNQCTYKAQKDRN
jgi:hypothetical protein